MFDFPMKKKLTEAIRELLSFSLKSQERKKVLKLLSSFLPSSYVPFPYNYSAHKSQVHTYVYTIVYMYILCIQMS